MLPGGTPDGGLTARLEENGTSSRATGTGGGTEVPTPNPRSCDKAAVQEFHRCA